MGRHTGTAKDIADLIGAESAAVLFNALGGVDFPFPKHVSRNPAGAARFDLLQELVGLSNACALIERYGGRALYIPKGCISSVHLRNQQIVREYHAGASVVELAMRYRLSTRQISNIRKRPQYAPQIGTPAGPNPAPAAYAFADHRASHSMGAGTDHHTGTAKDIVDLIGEESAVILFNALGGVDFPFPKWANSNPAGAARFESLQELVGLSNACALIRRYGGDTVYIPMGVSASVFQRNQMIVRDCDRGATLEELAIRYRLSSRQITSILKRTPTPPPADA